ncbi:substrate-binding domain-containing protein [Candidatus Bathyarchaeota archaeon]|nr:substrate-binding domain-containing protein [Candidatus Bathyarchaeota archaeon]
MKKQMKGLATAQITIIVGIVIVAALVGTYFFWPRPKTQLIVSTTTSLYETGFLDYLKQSFEQTNPGFNVSFISQGTGQAILTAQNGGADLVLVHAPSNELTFLNSTYGVNRKIVAYNFFLIGGPSSDPANITGSSTLDSFRKIKASGEAGQAVWVSRGDGSGTETKEKVLWKAAGINYTQISKEPWYLKAGQGMTATLLMANQMNVYTLSDTASYLNNFNKGNIQLHNFISGGSDLLNVYSAIAVNPQKIPTIKFDAAMTLVRYMVSDAGQNLFNTFGVQQYGGTVFTPCVQTLKTGTPADTSQMIKTYAYLKIGSDTPAECPTQWRYNADDLYS